MFRIPRSRIAQGAVITAAASALVAGGFVAHATIAAPSGPAGPSANAVAAVVPFSGKAVVATKAATDSAFNLYTNTTFAPVIGSSVDISVPSGGSRLVSSSFSGVERCDGSAGNLCSARIVTRKVGTTQVFEFYPQAGLNGAMDTAGSTDIWESHTISRTRTLTGGGTWRVWVEVAVTGDADFTIGAWHHEARVSAK